MNDFKVISGDKETKMIKEEDRYKRVEELAKKIVESIPEEYTHQEIDYALIEAKKYVEFRQTESLLQDLLSGDFYKSND